MFRHPISSHHGFRLQLPKPMPATFQFARQSAFAKGQRPVIQQLSFSNPCEHYQEPVSSCQQQTVAKSRLAVDAYFSSFLACAVFSGGQVSTLRMPQGFQHRLHTSVSA